MASPKFVRPVVLISIVLIAHVPAAQSPHQHVPGTGVAVGGAGVEVGVLQSGPQLPVCIQPDSQELAHSPQAEI